jgi:hypothetical protein
MKKYFLLCAVLFLQCRKSSAPKLFACQYQYNIEKTFRPGDTISFQGCPSDFSLTYIGPDSIQVYGPQSGVNVIVAYHGLYDSSTVDVCENESVTGSGWESAVLQLTYFSKSSVTIRVIYNYTF